MSWDGSIWGNLVNDGKGRGVDVHFEDDIRLRGNENGRLAGRARTYEI